jgi:hypothetical protein
MVVGISNPGAAKSAFAYLWHNFTNWRSLAVLDMKGELETTQRTNSSAKTTCSFWNKPERTPGLFRLLPINSTTPKPNAEAQVGSEIA